MAKRILILSISAGAGHLRAAEATAKAFHIVDPSLQIENFDMLDFTNKLFQQLYSKAYIKLAGSAPEFVGYLYDRLDRPPRNHRDFGGDLRRAFDKLNTRRFVKYIEKTKPDVIVNTHFLPAEIVSELKCTGRMDIPQAVITTDFEAHRMWAVPNVDQYYVATEESRNYLVALGVPSEIISITGIPIDPAFGEKTEKDNSRLHLGLRADFPVILVLCGGFGVGPLENIVEQLLETDAACQIAVVTGRNKKLKAKLQKVKAGNHHSLRIIGYTREMHTWMDAADLLISKPGGLTTSEALAIGLPMLVVNPIPGQESRNSDFLLENGAAVKANNLLTLKHKVEGLLKSARRLRSLSSKAASLGRPHAAVAVAEHVLSLLK